MLGVVMMRLPIRVGDAVARFGRRMAIGDRSAHGLPVPDEGVMSRLRRLGAAPSVVDRDVIDAITTNRVEVVAAVESLNEDAVRLADGSSLTPDAVICATGYRPGLSRWSETSAFWTPADVRRRSERRRPRRASASSATCRARAASGTAASRPGAPHA